MVLLQAALQQVLRGVSSRGVHSISVFEAGVPVPWHQLSTVLWQVQWYGVLAAARCRPSHMQVVQSRLLSPALQDGRLSIRPTHPIARRAVVRHVQLLPGLGACKKNLHQGPLPSEHLQEERGKQDLSVCRLVQPWWMWHGMCFGLASKGGHVQRRHGPRAVHAGTTSVGHGIAGSRRMACRPASLAACLAAQDPMLQRRHGTSMSLHACQQLISRTKENRRLPRGTAHQS